MSDHAKTAKGTDSYLRVLAYFQSHLCATTKEAARTLDISVSTVLRYQKMIRADWRRPEPSVLDPVAVEYRIRHLERVLSRFVADE